MFRSLLLVGSLLAFSLALSGCVEKSDIAILTLLSPSSQRIELAVEIADTPKERSRGLMFRKALPDGRGMLFVFDRPQVLAFWMKNTTMPLDILFFDEDGSIVSASTMEPCAAEPCPTYPSAAAARYALEVPAGFIERYGVGRGWTFDGASMPIPPQLPRP